MNYTTYLINMKKSAERYDFMKEQLDRCNIPFEIQEGFDGKVHDFSSTYDEAYARNFDTTFIPLDNREKGIALSHRTILEKFLASNDEYALVLEDDVEIPDNFKTILEREIHKREAKQTSWDYLSFNYPTVGLKHIELWLFLFFSMWKKNTSKTFYIKLPLYAIKFIAVVIISTLERIREVFYSTIFTYGRPSLFFRPLYLAGCYVVTRDGAKKLLNLCPKLIYTADRLPNVARIKEGLKFYAFVPLLVKQRRDKFRSGLPEDEATYFNN